MSQNPCPINYKTVRLARGKHISPKNGACVMELASMIAGEPFSDRPRSGSPMIAAFLRAYNDAIDDERRQDLYDYAARVIGTRDSLAIERRRMERCMAWIADMYSRRSWLVRRMRRTKAPVRDEPPEQHVARLAVRAIGLHTDSAHVRALALVEELCAITSQEQRHVHEDAVKACSDATAVATSDG
jgi:hypothetical protein